LSFNKEHPNMRTPTTSVAALCAAANVAEMGSPQQQIILRHLRERKDHGLSQFEAQNLYRIAALPRRISDLEEQGVSIRRERKQDPTGRSYTRYFLGDPASAN
jgi:DNA-binding MarR family transcriptional regulator